MSNKINWGIIGTGNMGHQFARGLAYQSEAELIAIGSRSATSAHRFGDEFNVPHQHASYEALANDPEIDVVYISTPHTLHKENSLLCLEAGKAVLCEKPFTLNADEAETVIQRAREKNLFLMEAMWARFVPAYVTVRQLLANGKIGDPQMLTADLGIQVAFDPQSRLFDPNLGGGALLDVGIYPLSLASMLFGPPTEITSMVHLGKSGVDERSAIILGYDDGQIATLTSAIRTETPAEAVIMGSKGRLKLHAPIFRPTKLTVSLTDQPDEVIEVPYAGNGYNYEVAEVMRCMKAGQLESEIMPLDESLTIMRTLDRIRAQWGLRYPKEARQAVR